MLSTFKIYHYLFTNIKGKNIEIFSILKFIYISQAMCANIKLLEGECMNKKNQILKQEDIMNILDNCYDKCLHGIPNISPSVEKMAKDYIKKIKIKMQHVKICYITKS